MKPSRDLVVANIAVLLALFVALWWVGWQAVLFGLGLLLILDLLVILRGRQDRPADDPDA
jgi:hypothetical protein